MAALSFGGILLTGLLCQTSQAQTILYNSTATLPDNAGITDDNLSVAYTVTEDASGLYTYDYTVTNPGTDTATVSDFEVGFNTATASVMNITGGGSVNNGVDWDTVITPGNNSGTLSFQSYDPPILANANANGAPNLPAPWASSNPGGTQVPVPSVVPEPATTTLLALTALLLPMRHSLRKKS